MKRDEDREQWDFVPFVSVGPLRFGMSIDEAEAALGAGLEWALLEASGRHPGAGITAGCLHLVAYFSEEDGLHCVAIDGLMGPQVAVDGVALVGRVPSEVERWMLDYAGLHGATLRYSPGADPHLVELGLVGRVQRAGDVVLSRPVFLARRVHDVHPHVPTAEWFAF
ncbi:hypothetical protein [Dactylosporangium sp. NPDC006015]|uniref:hypothetical protein n=1 Tax=Dactylosporangium sp. NPDC006015 TaxID=3154576 RepID=UPI0033AF83B3